MHPLERKIDQLIRQRKLLSPGEGLLLGVSAGPDSMALLHVLAGLAASWSWELSAVYVDHGLRPDETEAEAAMVRDAASAVGARFFCEQADVKTHSKKNGLSTEHSGRMLRYEIFEKIAEECGAAKIVVAHTADEQAEEVLLRLIRGSGRKGLAGMELLRDGLVVRPLLTTAKQELLDYLADRNIAYAVDSSNLDHRYLRNQVRLDLLPYLAERYNPNIQENLRRMAMVFQDEDEFLAQAAERAWQQVVVEEGEGGGGLVFGLAQFCDLPRAMQRRLLEAACWRFGQRPSFRVIAQLLALAETGGGAGRMHLGKGLRAWRDGEKLVFSRPQGKKPLRGDLAGPDAQPFSVQIDGPGIYLVPEAGGKLTVELLAPVPQPPLAADADWLDGDVAGFPMVARSVVPGDRFRPLGAPGRKKIGDFLTDAKVARKDRSRVLVLESAGRVAALPGLRIDHDFRITEGSKRAVKICWQLL